MATFLKIVAQLGPKAAKWAWDNKSKVMDWILKGMGIEWIINKINSMVS